MKEQKGITLISIAIYVVILLIVVAILATVRTSFESNIKEIGKQGVGSTELSKFNMYFLQEVKKQGNGVETISEDKTKIKFTSGNLYSYEEGAIYLQEGESLKKIVNGVASCTFTKKIENGKNIIEVKIKMNNEEEKSIEYVLNDEQSFSNYEDEDSYNNTVNEITASDINNASDKSQFYGAIVQGYDCPNSAGVEVWKILYADDTNIYLIAGDYISKDYCPNSATKEIYVKTDYILSMDYVIYDYAKGSESITDERPKKLNKLYFDYLEETSSTNGNNGMCAVAYMTDTSIWKVFAGDKAEYAIAGPTIEMLIKSHNQKYNTDFQINVISTGYQTRTDNNSDWGYTIYLNKNDSTYVISDETKAKSLWVASPSGTGRSDVFKVRSGGRLDQQNYANTPNDLGFRPVVCLKSSTQLIKNSDGTYTIK